MRRIGTISSAFGLIFLGVWMLIDQNNPGLAREIFKWWPILIVVLGIEVLVYYSSEKEFAKKPGFNFLIIPIIIIFICINVFQGIIGYIGGVDGSGFSFDKLIRYGMNFDSNNYKLIETTKVLPVDGKDFEFDADNGAIRFYKSQDRNIKVAARVYVDRGSDINAYNIKEIKNPNGCVIKMKEDYIKKVAADIYIPDGLNININTDSSTISTDGNFPLTSYTIKTNSSNVELSGGQQLILDIDSGNMDITDIKDVRIKGDSGKITVKGNTVNLDAKLDSGIITLENELCKNVNAELSSGIIKISTRDRNVNVNASIDSGICTVDGERRINAGVNKILGSGVNKVRIKMDSGTISFTSRE